MSEKGSIVFKEWKNNNKLVRFFLGGGGGIYIHIYSYTTPNNIYIYTHK